MNDEPNDEFIPGPKDVTTLAADDGTRAKQFVDWTEGELRYLPEEKRWAQWRDGQWRADGGERVMHDYLDFTGEMSAALEAIEDVKQRAAFMKVLHEARSHRSVTAAVSLAKGDENVFSNVTEWDKDPWLFGVSNGVIDLKTGIFREAEADDLMLKHSPVAHDAAATCPKFFAFLTEILPHTGLTEFVVRALGYSLTGETIEQKLFFMYGEGSNGKSTLIKILETILGDNAWRAGADLVMQGKNDVAPDTLLGPLIGRRLVIGAEVAEHARLAEARIKDLTGGDRLQGRMRYGQPFQFTPSHKLWLYGNSKPRISGTDNGVWRRMCLIPFTTNIPKEKVNMNLVNELLAEGPGILNLLLEGCLAWQQDGLQIPSVVTDAVSEYRDDEDIMGQFLDEECVFEAAAVTPRRVLVQAARAWGEVNFGLKNFGAGRSTSDRIRKALHARYPSKESGKMAGGERSWKGIRLRDPAAYPSDHES